MKKKYLILFLFTTWALIACKSRYALFVWHFTFLFLYYVHLNEWFGFDKFPINCKIFFLSRAQFISNLHERFKRGIGLLMENNSFITLIRIDSFLYKIPMKIKVQWIIVSIWNTLSNKTNSVMNYVELFNLNNPVSNFYWITIFQQLSLF